MKRLIIGLLALLSFAQAFTQDNDTTQYIYYRFAYGNRLDRYWANKVLMIPKDTIYSKDGLALKAGALYVGNGVKWTGLSGSGSIDTFFLATRGRLQKTTDSTKIINDARYLKKSDSVGTNAFMSFDRGRKVADSLGALIASGGSSFPRPNVVWSAAPDTITVPDGTSVLTINPVADSPYLMVILPTVGNANDSIFTIEVGGSITSGEVIAHVQIRAPTGQHILQNSTPDVLTAGDAIQYHQVGSLWRRRF